MKTDFNCENAVMIAGDYMYTLSDFYAYRNKKYPGWFGPRRGKDSDLDYKYENQKTKGEALWAVSAVTGIPEKVLKDCARIEQTLIDRTGGEKCLHESDYEKLISLMTAEEPRWTVWGNEYSERAWARIEAHRYAENPNYDRYAWIR